MTKLLYESLTFKIRKAFFNVYNNLGYGHKEHVYHEALKQEFEELGIFYKSEPNINVYYKNNKVGNYTPDFLIEDKIIIELKAVEFLPKSFENQLLHYLKSTNYHLGLLVNFGSPKLVIKRLIWTTSDPKKSTIRVNLLTIRENLNR